MPKKLSTSEIEKKIIKEIMEEVGAVAANKAQPQLATYAAIVRATIKIMRSQHLLK